MVYPPDSDVYMKRELSYISMDLFVKGSTEHFLRHIASENIILRTDGHRAHFGSPILIQSAAENDITILRLQNPSTHTLHTLDEGFLGL